MSLETEVSKLVNLCYASMDGCLGELNSQNRSEEHIIPNAIGGRLTSNKLLCKVCNSAFGDVIDFEIAEQLSLIANLLNIKRDDAKIPRNIRTSKGKYFLRAGGKPVLAKPEINVTKDDKGMKIHIESSPEKANKTLKGVQRKYGLPDSFISDAWSNSRKSATYLDEGVDVEFSLGGLEAFRSICKTAINFYIDKGGSRDAILHLLPYLKGDCDARRTFYFYPSCDIIKKTDSEILHSIIVTGDVEAGILYAYVEYFNYYKCLVVLNEQYRGESICESYFYDVLECVEVKRDFEISLTKREVLSMINATLPPYDEIKSEYFKVHVLALNKITYDTIGKIVDETFTKYPKGEIITLEMLEELRGNLLPFIVSRMRGAD